MSNKYHKVKSGRKMKAIKEEDEKLAKVSAKILFNLTDKFNTNDVLALQEKLSIDNPLAAEFFSIAVAQYRKFMHCALTLDHFGELVDKNKQEIIGIDNWPKDVEFDTLIHSTIKES